MSNEMIPKKSKNFVFGYMVGRASARIEYSGSEVFLNPNDEEMMDGYNEGFTAECQLLGKDPETLIERMDKERFSSMIQGALTLDVIIVEEEEYYGTITFLNQEGIQKSGSTLALDVKPWDRVKLALIYDDDETSFEPEWGEIEVSQLKFVDDVLRVVLRLERPIRSYLTPRRLQ